MVKYYTDIVWMIPKSHWNIRNCYSL